MKLTGIGLSRRLTLDEFIELTAFLELDHKAEECVGYRAITTRCLWRIIDGGRALDWSGSLHGGQNVPVEWLWQIHAKFFDVWGITTEGHIDVWAGTRAGRRIEIQGDASVKYYALTRGTCEHCGGNGAGVVVTKLIEDPASAS